MLARGWPPGRALDYVFNNGLLMTKLVCKTSLIASFSKQQIGLIGGWCHGSICV